MRKCPSYLPTAQQASRSLCYMGSLYPTRMQIQLFPPNISTYLISAISIFFSTAYNYCLLPIQITYCDTKYPTCCLFHTRAQKFCNCAAHVGYLYENKMVAYSGSRKKWSSMQEVQLQIRFLNSLQNTRKKILKTISVIFSKLHDSL